MTFHRIIATTKSGEEEIIELSEDYVEVKPYNDEFVTFRGKKYKVKQVEREYNKTGLDTIVLTLVENIGGNNE